MSKIENDLRNELNRLYANHTCTVTPEMEEEDLLFRKHLKIVARTSGHTFTLFNLKTGRHSCHYSANNVQLPRKAINADVIDNRYQADELTHPDDVEFVLGMRIAAYKYLMELPIDHRRNFLFIYLQRIMNNEGGFQLSLHRLKVSQFDKEGNPFQMLIESELLPIEYQSDKTKFRIYTLKPILQDVTIKTTFYQCVELLTERELQVLCKSSLGHSKKITGEELYISIHTVRTHYLNIRNKLHAKSVSMACYLAKRMEIVYFEEN